MNSIGNLDRKVSVTEAERLNLASLNEKEQNQNGNIDKQQNEKNSMPRDVSVDALASRCPFFI